MKKFFAAIVCLVSINAMANCEIELLGDPLAYGSMRDNFQQSYEGTEFITKLLNRKGYQSSLNANPNSRFKLFASDEIIEVSKDRLVGSASSYHLKLQLKDSGRVISITEGQSMMYEGVAVVSTPPTRSSFNFRPAIKSAIREAIAGLPDCND